MSNKKQESSLIPFLQEYGPYLAFTVALIATGGSLFYSNVMLFVPCQLCWIQRIFMYPITIISLVGIIKQDDYITDYVLPLSAFGFCVGIYHVLVQFALILPFGDCVGVPCTTSYVRYLGFITIPVMSTTAFFLITTIMGATRWANSRG